MLKGSKLNTYSNYSYDTQIRQALCASIQCVPMHVMPAGISMGSQWHTGLLTRALHTTTLSNLAMSLSV